MRKLIALCAIVIFMAGLVGVAVATPPGKNIEWEGGGAGKVVFEGKIHASAGTKCNACHPKLFKMKKGSNPITMKDINDGKSCGTCHDGQTAFAAKECAKCHQK